MCSLHSANAATFYWDANGAVLGFGSANGGKWSEDNTSASSPGTGRWTTSAAGTIAGSATQATGNADAFNFGTATDGLSAGTINITGTVNMGSTTYGSASGEIVLSGGTIAFAAISTVTVNNATNTINSIVGGAGTSFTKAGSGILVLTGANTYAGTTIVSAGTLDLGGGTATGSVASTTLNLSGGAFHYTRNDSATETFTTTNLNSQLSSISVSSGNTLNLGTVSRAVGVNFDLSSTGAGKVAALAASNTGGIMSGVTFGDTWAVANGAGIAISGLDGSSYTLSSVAGTTGSNYTANNIDVDDSAGALDAGITTNSLRFSSSAANTLSLTGANSISSGGILVNSTVGSNVSTITGGTLAGAPSKDLVIIQNNAAGGLIIESSIINNGGASALTKTGSGILTLSGNNTFTGGLFLNGGALIVNNAGALNSTVGSENALAFRNGTAGTLTLNGNSVIVSSISGGSSSHIVQNADADAATFTIGNSTDLSSTFGGIIRDGTGAGALTLAKSGTGTLTLNNAANSYSGGTVINEGIVLIAADDRLGDTSGDITFNGNAKLLVSTNNVTLAATRTITVNSGIAVMGDSNINANPINFTIDGQITGAGGIQLGHYQLGSGITRLTSTASNFSGALILGTSNTHSYTYSGFTVEAASLADGVGHGNIVFGRGNGSSANSAAFIWSNAATSALLLEHRRIELDTTVEQSTVSNNNSNTARTVTVDTDLLISRAGNKTFTLSGINTGDNAFNGDIANGTGAVITLSKTGAGTWIIKGDNSHTGGTSVTAGKLNINSATALGNGTFTIGAATFDNTSDAAIINTKNNAQAWNGDFTFTGTQALDLGTGTVTLGGNRSITIGGAGLTIGGAIDGAFTFTKGGGGTLTLTSTNSSYSGTTTISQGTVTIRKIADYGNNSSLGNAASGDIQLGNGNTQGILNYEGEGDETNRTIAIGNNVAANTGNARINANGSDTLIFKATNFNAARSAVTATRNLVLGGAGNGEIQGIIQNNNAGLVGINKLDAGTWTLGGANEYTGATNVNAGTLKISATGSTHTSSAVTVSNSGTALIVDGTVNGTLNTGAGTIFSGSGTISGSTTIQGIHNPGNSPGIQTFGDDLTYSGGASVVNLDVDSYSNMNPGNPNALFDQMLVAGDLNFAATTTVNLVFNGANSTVDWSNPLWNDSQSWLVYDVAGDVIGFDDLELNVIDWLDGNENPFLAERPDSTFSFSNEVDGIYLNYTVIPEPSTALLGGLSLFALLRRRRK